MSLRDKFETLLFRSKTVGEFFFNQGEYHGTKLCQIDADTGEEESFLSAKKRSIRLAIALKHLIHLNDNIVLCSNNTSDNFIPILAAFYLGAKVASLDPTLSVHQVSHLLKLTSPKIMFVEESSIKLIEESLKVADIISNIIVFGRSFNYINFFELTQPIEGEDCFKPVSVDENDTALLFFSSGTTGLPKVICHSHFSFFNVIRAVTDNGIKNERTLYFTTFYWISAWLTLFRSYLEGTCRVISRSKDPEENLKTIERYKVTTIFMSPLDTYRLTTFIGCDKFDVSSLKCFLTGGTTMSPEQRTRLGKLFRNASILYGYGMTEVGIVSTFYLNTPKEFLEAKLASCGQILQTISLKIVDLESNKVLGANEKGEIYVKTKAAMVGYYKEDCSNVFDADGFLKTGDVGYYDEDNCLYVIGRIKEIFKYCSWHIAPALIESVLLEHSAVKEALVFGIPKAEKGEVPAACVTLEDNSAATAEEIRAFVDARVSDVEKLRGGVFILPNLPKTPTGKLRRQGIPSLDLKAVI